MLIPPETGCFSDKAGRPARGESCAGAVGAFQSEGGERESGDGQRQQSTHVSAAPTRTHEASYLFLAYQNLC